MLTTGMQNLPEPLPRAPAAYHDGTARLAPASADRLARRVEHFARRSSSSWSTTPVTCLAWSG